MRSHKGASEGRFGRVPSPVAGADVLSMPRCPRFPRMPLTCMEAPSLQPSPQPIPAHSTTSAQPAQRPPKTTAITDDSHRLALLSTPTFSEESNAPRRALDGGATLSSCLEAAVVPVTMAASPSPSCHRLRARKRRLHRDGSPSSGSSSCGVVEDVRLLATPFVALSGVQCVRCPTCPCPVTGVPVSGLGRLVSARLISARLISGSALSAPWWVRGANWSWGQSALGSAGERPAADRRACAGGDRGTVPPRQVV